MSDPADLDPSPVHAAAVQSATVQSAPGQTAPAQRATGPSSVARRQTDQVATSQLPPSCPRRSLLKAAGLVALAGGGAAVLAACGASQASTPAAGSAPTSSGAASTGPSSSPPSASASSKAKASGSVPSGPSVAKADVPQGSGVIMDTADYVVTQPVAGEFRAFSSTCTHMGFKVGEVDGGVIKCLHHGSEFSIKDGSVIHGPAASPLPAAKVTVSGNELVISG